VEYLTITYEIDDDHLANSLFGDSLKRRTYADSQGVVDYSQSKGGRLTPIISKESKQFNL